MTNPYASPVPEEALPKLRPVESPAEQIRKQHLVHERVLRQNTYVITGLLVAFGSVYCIVAEHDMKSVSIGVVLVAGQLLCITCCFGVTRLKAWARKPTLVMAGLSFLPIPIGLAFGIGVLQSLFTGPQPYVLTPQFEQIVAETKHLTPRTSILTWVALVLIVILIVAVIVIAQIPPEFRHAR